MPTCQDGNKVQEHTNKHPRNIRLHWNNGEKSVYIYHNIVYAREINKTAKHNNKPPLTSNRDKFIIALTNQYPLQCYCIYFDQRNIIVRVIPGYVND